MNVRHTLLSAVTAASITLGGATALAQSSTPAATPDSQPVSATTATVNPVAVKSADGTFMGYVTLWEDGEGVHLVLRSAGGAVLEPGEHGVHLHETGVCDASTATPFESAGGHFNPTDEHHGDLNADPSHGGDMGNLTVETDGSFEFWADPAKVTLAPHAENSLQDHDGTAIVIHAGTDDLSTDPSGESGDREACGVIYAPMEDAATPVASPEATPAN